MKSCNICLLLVSMFVFVLSISACSKSRSPLEPAASGNYEFFQESPDSFVSQTDNRTILAYYDAVIDPVAETFTITPVTRDAQYHFPLTQMYPNCLQITGYGWTPNFWADIKLTHPLPGSGIDAFDPRVIAILPANPGVSMDYPSLGVNANNSVILEPDGYTALFNQLAPGIPGNVNPFMAYFKDVPYRRWSSLGLNAESKRWQMDLDGFGGALQFKLVVDVSTNYPNPPTPVIDNAPEPFAVISTVGDGLTSSGGSAEVTVTVYDWQEQSTIGGVNIEAPSLIDVLTLQYWAPGSNPNEYVYKRQMYNSKLAPAGKYSYLVATWDQATEIHLYKEFELEVKEATGNLIWAKSAGGLEADQGVAITNVAFHETAATGYFLGTVVFGKNEPNETTLFTPDMSHDVFISRYKSDGALAWAKSAGGIGGNSGRGITSLSDESVVVTGYFSNGIIFGSGEPNQTHLVSAGTGSKSDIFIARYNTDGTLAWAKRAGGTSEDQGYAITALSDDSIVTAGHFSGIATFGAGEPNQTAFTSAGGYDIFLARYNPDGTLAWAKRAGGTKEDKAHSVTALSDNSTVVTGFYWGPATFGPGEPNETTLPASELFDFFIARYNPDGTLQWVKRSNGWDFCGGLGVTAMSDDSVVATGYFYTHAIFGEGDPNETTLTSDGSGDIFIARYGRDGILEWAKRAGGDDYDKGTGITTLSDDSVVVTGTFRDRAEFGEGPDQVTLEVDGNCDSFFARYNSNGTLAWVKQAFGRDMNESFAITALSNDSVVATGYFASDVSFGSGEPNQTTLISAGAEDIFIARFEP